MVLVTTHTLLSWDPSLLEAGISPSVSESLFHSDHLHGELLLQRILELMAVGVCVPTRPTVDIAKPHHLFSLSGTYILLRKHVVVEVVSS